MGGGKESAVVKNTGALDYLEATLREARLNGHAYIELRKVGENNIFFCVLCQEEFVSNRDLNAHLKDYFHKQRYDGAKLTLFGPNPWPFSDGVFFFTTLCENDVQSNEVMPSIGGAGQLRIRGVALKGELGNLKAQFIGHGHIGARIPETDKGFISVSRIWCAWLGQEDSYDFPGGLNSPECDFSIVSFSYTNILGKPVNLNDLAVKKKKSLSDPEYDHLSGSSEDDSSQQNLLPIKRKRECLTAERNCNICDQAMHPGKDVSTLLNCKTGKLACSSRNANGAFHLFHTSCLIHWILFYESETWNQAATMITSKRKRKAKQPQKTCISTCCLECLATGMHKEGDKLEKLTAIRDKLLNDIKKIIEAHKAWRENPEELKQCSTGLHFSSDSSVKLLYQKKLLPLKLLRFYRANE